MSKRVLRLVSILFLSSILVLSCSNANKTGSGNNDSGNGGSSTGGDGGTGTGGDGGTTQTPEGIAKYAGTWTATFDNGMTTYDIIIGSDETVTIKDPSGKQIKAENIEGSGNTYTMKVDHGTGADNVTITFDSETTGSIDDIYGIGSITKIK